MVQHQKIFRNLFYISLFVATFLSLTPGDRSFQFGYRDKINHFLAYAVISFLFQSGYWTKKKIFLSISSSVLLVIYSIGIEWVQQFVHRDPSWFDVIANTTGVMTGLLIAKLFQYIGESKED